MSTASKAELLSGCVGWLNDRLMLFSPARARTVAQALPAFKRLGELAMAAELRERRQASSGRAWLDAAWEMLDRGDALLQWLPQIPALIALYPPFARSGFRSPQIDAMARRDDFQRSALAMPSRLQFALRLALIDCELPAPGSYRDAMAEEPLLRHAPPSAVSSADQYAIAHAVFWLTDFGRLPARLDSEHAVYCRQALPVLIARALAVGNIDLLAELMLTSHCLTDCAPPAAWRALFQCQAENGLVVRGLCEDPRVWLRDRTEAQVFWENAHSTLTALMAACMCPHGELDASHG